MRCMSADRYTLDANILFYALNPDDMLKHHVAMRLWEGATANDCVLTLQALGEVYHAVNRKASARVAEARRALMLLASVVPVVSANRDDFISVLQLHGERPVQFWDSMLWATARRSGCHVILTEDFQDRVDSDGVRYLNPFKTTASELEPYL